MVAGGIPTHVVSELNKQPLYIGGSMGMAYNPKSMTNQLLAWLNNTRARWTGISFGNQAQFFRKEALEIIGGYPNLMFMEDVELAMRLKEKGLLYFIPRGVVVSNRRWDKLGFWSNFKRTVKICLVYLIKRRLGTGDETGRSFYEQYYVVIQDPEKGTDSHG